MFALQIVIIVDDLIFLITVNLCHVLVSSS